MTIDWNQAVNNYIIAKSKERQPDILGPNVFRCSSLSGCVRSCVKSRTGKQEFGIDTLKHFELGTLLHRFLQRDVALGFVTTPTTLERNFEFEKDGIILLGHADAVDDDTVYDFKTTSSLTTTLNYPTSTGYVYQLSAYCHGLSKQHGIVVYIDKRTLTIAQREIEILPISQIISFCKQVMEAEKHYKETGELPPPCEKGKDCFNCKREREGR